MIEKHHDCIKKSTSFKDMKICKIKHKKEHENRKKNHHDHN